MAKATIVLTMQVEVDLAKWAAEYHVTEEEAARDALAYVPQLLKDGLSRQKDWGVVTEIGTFGERVARRDV